MPETAAELTWTLLGLAMLGIAGYMVATRVIVPRFGSGWLNRRDREQAIERGEALLARDDLDDETRYQLLSRINSLRARGAQRESWGNSQIADRITVQEVLEICDRFEGGGQR